MKVAIRAANLESDRQLIIEALSRFVTRFSSESRFSWLYKDNPAGSARAWIAYTADETIGVAAAFPRRVYVGGQEEFAWVLGDFCTNDKYRSLGPALQLQRACLAAANSEGVRFCYDFPSRAMMAVYKRLGIPVSHKIRRLAKPLHLDRKLRELIRWPLAAGTLGFVGNLYLYCLNSIAKHNSSLIITLHEGDCGEEFSALALLMKHQNGISVAHSAEYLNWRYIRNPLYKYKIFTARRNGILLGYVVLLHSGDDALLVDLFGSEEESIVDALVSHVIALLITREVQTLSAVLTEAHPWGRVLERHGFRVRESSPMVVHYAAGGPIGQSTSGQEFLFMHGDRDS